MKHFKKFESHSEYEAFTGTTNFIKPNVSVCENDKEIHYNKYEKRVLNFKYIQDVYSGTNISQQYFLTFKRSGYSGIPDMVWKIKDLETNELTIIKTDYNSGNYDYFYNENPFDFSIEIPYNYTQDVNFSRVLYSGKYDYFEKTRPICAYKYYSNPYSNAVTLCSCSGDLKKFFSSENLGRASIMGFFANDNSVVNYYSPLYSKIPELSGLTFLDYAGAYLCVNQEYLNMPIKLTQETLYEGCFAYMFKGCSLINDVEVHFTQWLTTDSESLPKKDATYCWLSGVSSTGIFRCPHDLPIERGISRIPEGWDIVYID